MRILCIGFAILLAGIHFPLRLLQDFAVYLDWQIDFGISSVFLLGTVVAFLTAVFLLFRNLVFHRSVQRAVCPALIILSLATAAWIKRETSTFGDVVFFRLNEADLRKRAQSEERSDGTKTVFLSSRGNVHRLFAYIGRRQFSNGPLSLEEIDMAGDPLVAFRGCKTYAAPLRSEYYAFYIEC